MTHISSAHQASSPFSALLKEWRASRRLTQLQLALEAGVSQRHVSFLESGRSKPSRASILQLATALDLSLRDRNQLLESAGFIALYEHRPLEGPAMAPVRTALELMLQHHNPYPAIVVDRDWNLLLNNQAWDRLGDVLGGAESLWPPVVTSTEAGNRNIMRLTLHPNGLRNWCQNWHELAPALLQRLRRDLKMTSSPALATLLQELQEDSTLDEYWHLPIVDIAPKPVYHMSLGVPGAVVNLFSVISTFGTPQDITTDELRVESFFPADDASAELLKSLATDT